MYRVNIKKILSDPKLCSRLITMIFTPHNTKMDQLLKHYAEPTKK